MDELFAYRGELLSCLGSVADQIAEKVRHLPSASWYQPIETGSHSPHYVLFHLRELEAQVFALELPRLLAEDTPVLPSFDDEAWMASHYDPEEPIHKIMQAITELRRHELSWLRHLSPADWSRSARHPWWGKHTLQWWVELQLEYSFQHLDQLPPLKDV